MLTVATFFVAWLSSLILALASIFTNTALDISSQLFLCMFVTVTWGFVAVLGALEIESRDR